MAHPQFKKRRKTRITSIGWLAQYCKVNRHTMSKWLRDEGTDLYDTQSVFDFLLKRSERIKYEQGGKPHFLFGKYFDPIAYAKNRPTD